MDAPIPVALLGFGSFERNALASYLRLQPDRKPAYTHVLDLDEARFVVADGDQPGVDDLLETLGRTGDAVIIGAHGPARAAARLPRPIDPSRVVRELDRLLAARLRPGVVAGVPAANPPAPGASEVTRPGPAGTATRSAEGAAPARLSINEEAPPDLTASRRADAAVRRQRSEDALRPASVRRALLVDDSEVALAFLERHLQRCDIPADQAMSSGQALELMARQAYGIVFLDVDLGEHSELDGLALCKVIKGRQLLPGAQAPMVVLVSAFNDPADRVRGLLAGADGYIGKPLAQAELDRLLGSHGLLLAARQPTRRKPP